MSFSLNDFGRVLQRKNSPMGCSSCLGEGFSSGKVFSPCALKASFQIYGRKSRTRFRYAERVRVSPPRAKKEEQPRGLSFLLGRGLCLRQSFFALRLVSKLSDLRAKKPNSLPLRGTNSSRNATGKKRRTALWAVLLFLPVAD